MSTDPAPAPPTPADPAPANLPPTPADPAPAPTPVDPGPYRPEGLADNLFGTSDHETIDKLNAAVKGYRDRDASRQVPESVEGYSDFNGVELPQSIKGHMEGLAKDPIFQSAAEVAKKHGVGKAAMQQIVAAAYSSAAENGILEPPVDVQAERNALLPKGYENIPADQQNAAINARLQANADFMQLLVKQGSLSEDVANHAIGMLMDTAAGNLFLESFRNMITAGHGPQPYGSGSGATDASRGALQQELARVNAKRGTPDWKPEEYEQIMQRYKKAFGE